MHNTLFDVLSFTRRFAMYNSPRSESRSDVTGTQEHGCVARFVGRLRGKDCANHARRTVLGGKQTAKTQVIIYLFKLECEYHESDAYVLRGRHTVRFSRTKIADCLANQSIVRVAGDTRVSETGHSYDIEFRTCPKLLPMLSDERRH